MTSVQSAVVKLAGTPVPVEGASWEHGVSLRAGDVVGSSGSVDWAEGAVIPASQMSHPLRPGWSRTNGASCTVDAVVDGVTTRVFTGQVESSGGALTAGSSSSLTDWAKRLDTRVHVPPVAFTRAPRALTEETTSRRRVGLWGTWITHLVMARAGFNTCQSVQDSAVWYQSFAGSAWTHPNPDHTVDTLGHLTTVHRLGNAGSWPQPAQGTNMPVMSEVYALGSTISRRRSTNTAWQLTVDMASDAPTTGHTGRVDIRTLPQSVGAGVRLDWTQTVMRVYRRATDGTLTLLASAARAVSGVYTMRWSLVVRQDGTLSLHGSGGRLNAATASSHGIQLPSTSDPATVIVESEGPCSAVQVTRSDATSIVTQNTAARIYRASYSIDRMLSGFDYIPPTPAIDILTDQAGAERGLLGMPLWMWIDQDGRLINAEAGYLANQPVTHHFSTTSAGTPLDDVRWTRPPAGPYSRVDVRCRFAVPHVRSRPTLLLYEGRQQNHANGDLLDEYLHPSQEQTWLGIDWWPYFAGQPLPPPGDQELNRGIGSHVGGMVVTAADGERVGWVTPAQITGWSINASNHVVGALQVLDHRTVLYKGTVNVGGGYAMSTMPDQGSAGLWQHRAVQPLPQLRGNERIDWTEQVTTVTASGNVNAPVYEHDAGEWVHREEWRGQIADALAAAANNPVSELSLSVGFDPTVRVGQRVTAHVAYPDGAHLEVEGLVAGVAGSAPADRDQMSVRLVLLSNAWTEAPAPGADPGDPVETDYEIVAPNLPRIPPPGTDPPNLPTVEDT